MTSDVIVPCPTPFWDRGSFLQIRQPNTGVDLFLTGMHRSAWLLIQSRRRANLAELREYLDSLGVADPASAAVEVADRLTALRLVTREDTGGW